MSTSVEEEDRVRDSVERARAQLPEPRAQAELARLRRVLCDPVRCQIVRALRAGPLSVDELARVVERTPQGTSQHLRVLRELGVVEARPDGRARRYRLRAGGLAERVAQAARMLEELAA
jgi:DNA-binding transcriptional ArsR family regulator